MDQYRLVVGTRWDEMRWLQNECLVGRRVEVRMSHLGIFP
jgi:hypothetical protein